MKDVPKNNRFTAVAVVLIALAFVAGAIPTAADGHAMEGPCTPEGDRRDDGVTEILRDIFDDHDDGEGEFDGGPLCPDPFAELSCSSAALAVVADTVGGVHSVLEGTSRSAVSWFGESSGSGSLHDTSLFNGMIQASTLGSTCETNINDREYCTTGTAAVQRLVLFGTEISLLDSKTEFCEGDLHQSSCLFGGEEIGCAFVPMPPSGPQTPGVSVNFHVSGTQNVMGQMVAWTAAAHIHVDDQASCALFGICDRGFDIYVAYTSVGFWG